MPCFDTPDKEAGIDQLDFIAAPINNSRQWQWELNNILNHAYDNTLTLITFETKNGTWIVETTVESVIENYVKIRGGVIIPLSSIISIKSPFSFVSVKPDSLKDYLIILVLILIFLCLAVYC